MRLHLAPVLIATVLLGIGACRTGNQEGDSDVLTERDAETSVLTPQPIFTFVAAAKQVLVSPGQTGTIAARDFIALMPLSIPDRQKLNAAYPGAFNVTCQGQRCAAAATGATTQATLLASVSVSFFVTISDPTLTVADGITTNFILRGDQGIEFCDVTGMQVTKLAFSQPIRGLYERIEGGQPRLTVSDAAGDFTCAP